MATTLSARVVVPAAVSGQVAPSQFLTGRALRLTAPAAAPCVRGNSLVVRADAPAKTSDRQTYFASKQSLSYLDGSLPGDFGFDPLGLSDPEGAGGFIDPNWLSYAEVFNARWAMLGVAGMIGPEILGKLGLIPEVTRVVWFRSGVIPPLGSYDYWADPYTLFGLELALIGFAEHKRGQDYYNPGSQGKQFFLGLEKGLGGSGNPAYPGGPFFNPFNFGKDEASMKDLKLKEIKNGRLAMISFAAYNLQAVFTGKGPFENLLDHLSDPVNQNILTNFKLH